MMIGHVDKQKSKLLIDATCKSAITDVLFLLPFFASFSTWRYSKWNTPYW